MAQVVPTEVIQAAVTILLYQTLLPARRTDYDFGLIIGLQGAILDYLELTLNCCGSNISN